LSEWSYVRGRVRPACNADVRSHVPRSPRQHSNASQAPSAEHSSFAPSLWPLQGNVNRDTDEPAQKTSRAVCMLDLSLPISNSALPYKLMTFRVSRR